MRHRLYQGVDRWVYCHEAEFLRTPPTEAKYANALERTDRALRNVLAGKPVRDADEILSANAWLLFAAPTEDESRV